MLKIRQPTLHVQYKRTISLLKWNYIRGKVWERIVLPVAKIPHGKFHAQKNYTQNKS